VSGGGYGPGHNFPFTPGGHPGGQNYQDQMYMLMESLPDNARASSLCEGYVNNYTWFFRPLSRGELFQELLAPILSDRNSCGRPGTGHRLVQPHRMAVLFFIFAIATWTDQPRASESDRYFQLGRMALSMRSVFDAPRLDTIQAVSLMAAYMSNCGGKRAVEEGWSYLGIAIRLAISVSGIFVFMIRLTLKLPSI